MGAESKSRRISGISEGGNPRTDLDASRPLVSFRETRLGMDLVPKELVTLVNSAYSDISAKLRISDKISPDSIPVPPKVYLCTREDLERLNTLAGKKPFPEGHKVGALYLNVPHAMYIVTEEVLKTDDNDERKKVFHEMTHALTTFYDQDSHMLRTGFLKERTLGEESAQKALEGRAPKDACEFYTFEIENTVDTPIERDYTGDTGAVYDEQDTYTENTTELIAALMTQPEDTDVGIVQSIDGSGKSSLRAIASGKVKDYGRVYGEQNEKADIVTDLLVALALGDNQSMDVIADRMYTAPSNSLGKMRDGWHQLRNPEARLRFELNRVVTELKNPKSSVYSLPRVT